MVVPIRIKFCFLSDHKLFLLVTKTKNALLAGSLRLKISHFLFQSDYIYI